MSSAPRWVTLALRAHDAKVAWQLTGHPDDRVAYLELMNLLRAEVRRAFQ